jgi:hypothetical protein
MHKRPVLGLRSTLLAITAIGALSLLAGCANGNAGTGVKSVAPAALRLTGRVYGGQNPVAGASIQLYTVGTTGLGSASTGMIAAPLPTTDQYGNYSIGGVYGDCTGDTPGTAPGTLVYLVASGGSSIAGETNSNLLLMAALGPCSALGPNTIIDVNEVTTVAAAYALAPFAKDYAHIGATGTYPAGLVAALQNASLLADTGSGSTGGAGLAAGVTAPVAELNTLGNILATCINTGGAAAADGGNCTTLFNATSAAGYSAVPATPDTFGAALGIAKNPGASAVVGLFTLPTQAGAPFAPSLSQPPRDFSVAVTFAGPAGTLATPYGLALDANGNAWVANASGKSVTQISPLGAASSFTAAGLFGAQGIAVDKANNVWVANTAGNSVLEFTAASSYATATPFTANLAGPSAVALDSQGNAWVANFNGGSVTEIAGGVAGTPFTGGGNITLPSGLALDGSANVYVTSGSGAVVELNHSGALVGTLTDNALQGPVSVATNAAGQVVAAGYTTGAAVAASLSEFSSGAAASVSPVATSFVTPGGIAAGGQVFWVANSSANGGLLEYSYGATVPVSPSAGFGPLNGPVGVALDNTGSVWTANSGSNTVSKFIGLATPVVMPLAANVGP